MRNEKGRVQRPYGIENLRDGVAEPCSALRGADLYTRHESLRRLQGSIVPAIQRLTRRPTNLRRSGALFKTRSIGTRRVTQGPLSGRVWLRDAHDPERELRAGPDVHQLEVIGRVDAVGARSRGRAGI